MCVCSLFLFLNPCVLITNERPKSSIRGLTLPFICIYLGLLVINPLSAVVNSQLSFSKDENLNENCSRAVIIGL